MHTNKNISLGHHRRSESEGQSTFSPALDLFSGARSSPTVGSAKISISTTGAGGRRRRSGLDGQEGDEKENNRGKAERGITFIY